MTRREFLAAAAAAAALGRTTAVGEPARAAVRVSGVGNRPGHAQGLGRHAESDEGLRLFLRRPQSGAAVHRALRRRSEGLVHSHGFTFTNALWPYQAFASRFDQTVADSQTLGLKTIVCSPRPRLRTTDEWKAFADELNRSGERTKAAGLQLGYHNHEIEFVKTPQGDAPWDVLVQATDPALVQFLLDVGNCAFGGGDPYAYLDKYKARYYGVHVKDLKPCSVAPRADFRDDVADVRGFDEGEDALPVEVARADRDRRLAWLESPSRARRSSARIFAR